jgi:hypothetical protein
MPKTTTVIRNIKTAADKAGLNFQHLREGGNHTIYILDGLNVPIARHANTDGYLEVRIYKLCEVKLGKGWWRRR